MAKTRSAREFAVLTYHGWLLHWRRFAAGSHVLVQLVCSLSFFLDVLGIHADSQALGKSTGDTGTLPLSSHVQLALAIVWARR